MQFSSKWDVHLWLAELNWTKENLEKSYLLLDQEERARADRFAVPHARCEFIASHFVLRQVLASYLSQPPQSLVFARREHGKPYLVNFPALEFNLSHTRGFAMIGITQGLKIGVDIERFVPERRIDALAQRFFSPAESHALLQVASSQRLAAFYRLWTRKEAFIKATGQGLSFGLDQFEVSLAAEGHHCLLSVRHRVDLAQKWKLGSVTLKEGAGTCAAAFAVCSPNINVQIKYYFDLLSER